jgi:hypothetical protein
MHLMVAMKFIFVRFVTSPFYKWHLQHFGKFKPDRLSGKFSGIRYRLYVDLALYLGYHFLTPADKKNNPFNNH